MKILGCDLHAKQQTIAMVDTETGEFTEKTLIHEGNEVREFYAALEGPVVWWASKPPELCSGFWNYCWNYWKSLGSCAGWVIPRRFGPPRLVNKSMIGVTP